MLKSAMKSFFTVMVALITCYYYPLCCYAKFDINNDHYVGFYGNLTNPGSFINLSESNNGTCTVSIVYSELENKFITATGHEGYIEDDYFYAEFPSFIIKKANGTTVRRCNYETQLSGTVSQKYDDYVDITVGGIVYEKTS